MAKAPRRQFSVTVTLAPLRSLTLRVAARTVGSAVAKARRVLCRNLLGRDRETIVQRRGDAQRLSRAFQSYSGGWRGVSVAATANQANTAAA